MRPRGSNATTLWRLKRRGEWPVWVFAALAILTVLPAICQTAPEGTETKTPRSVEKGLAPAQPTAAAQEPSARQAAAGPADPARAQIAEDCAALLKLAKELKVEMDKAGTAALSLGVVRKAEAIQKLTHKIHQEMKPVVEKK